MKAGRGAKDRAGKEPKEVTRKMQSIACKELEQEVIKQSLCTFCGACTGMCPYLVAYRGRVVLRDECTLEQGRCRTFCPRAAVDLNEIHRAVFGAPYEWNSMGKAGVISTARATDAAITGRAQYGGVVTALMALALKEGTIDGAVLTRSGADGLPEGVLATTKEEILGCAGSGYIASPTIGTFNSAVKEGKGERIGVVGTPCQMLALSKMTASPSDMQGNAKNIGLTIGLFCTWAFLSEEFLRFLEEKVPLANIVKVDIPPPPANVFRDTHGLG